MKRDHGTDKHGVARDPAPEALPDLIRRRLLEVGLTEEQLALASAASLRTISRLVCGQTRLRIVLAFRLAKALRTTPLDLLFTQLKHEIWVYERVLATRDDYAVERTRASTAPAASGSHFASPHK